MTATNHAGTPNATVIERGTGTGSAMGAVVPARTTTSTLGAIVMMTAGVSAGTTNTDTVVLLEKRNEEEQEQEQEETGGDGGGIVMDWARLRGGLRPHRTSSLSRRERGRRVGGTSTLLGTSSTRRCRPNRQVSFPCRIIVTFPLLAARQPASRMQCPSLLPIDFTIFTKPRRKV